MENNNTPDNNNNNAKLPKGGQTVLIWVVAAPLTN